MKVDVESTICGIATGSESSFRGAIRLSGPETAAILTTLIPDFSSVRSTTKPIRLSLAWSLDNQLGSVAVDVWYWPTKRSYTGMTSAELHTIGHPLILKRIVEQLCSAGAALARPGEFTLRAFLAGRMDLTQCEAVLAVIDAKGEKDLHTALEQLAGGLKNPLLRLRQDLIELLADIEAGLDFVDEDIVFIEPSAVQLRLQNTQGELAKIQTQVRSRQTEKAFPRVVLVGEPNAGKSSLFNRLAKRKLAIASELAGTTRDSLRVPLSFQHGQIELVDTAGFESSRSDTSMDTVSIANQAQQRRFHETQNADLILYCIDRSTKRPIAVDQLERFLEELASLNSSSGLPSTWIVWTKCDEQASADDIVSTSAIERQVSTSSLAEFGIEELRQLLDDWLAGRHAETSSVAPLTAVRCASLLDAANQAIDRAFEISLSQQGDELLCGELRLALEQLGQVAGETCTDDILDALFSRFCIGK
jgi:tRNA modification GTPase